MDLTSILPLLMQNKGGGDNNNLMNMASMLSGMNGGNADMAKILSTMNNGGGTGTNSNGIDPSVIMNLANSKDPNSRNMGLVNILSSMQKNKKQSNRPYGLKPIRSIVPDEILGKLVKFFAK